jgi:hypothetical protein
MVPGAAIKSPERSVRNLLEHSNSMDWGKPETLQTAHIVPYGFLANRLGLSHGLLSTLILLESGRFFGD